MNDLYYAGLFDGEGCALINQSGRGYYYLRVRIAMIGPEYLFQNLKERYGGSYGKDTGVLDVTWWCGTGANAYVFLKKLRPHLHVKCAEADLSMEFHEWKLKNISRGCQTHPENVEKMEEYKERLSWLNSPNRPDRRNIS